jgi:hypothetical protein
VKPLLYVYRVLLTGIHLMRTGEVEANLLRLNEEFRLPYLDDLIARKLAGPERATIADADLPLHEAEYARLRGMLEEARDASHLPAEPSGRAALNELLVRVRLGGVGTADARGGTQIRSTLNEHRHRRRIRFLHE